MVSECAGLSKGLTTHVTHVRLLPAVQPAADMGGVNHRLTDMGGVKHRGQTGLDHDRTQRMPHLPDVYFVVGGCGKLEAAALAGVWLLLAVVHPPVSHQLTFLSETLVTVGAVKRLLT